MGCSCCGSGSDKKKVYKCEKCGKTSDKPGKCCDKPIKKVD